MKSYRCLVLIALAAALARCTTPGPTPVPLARERDCMTFGVGSCMTTFIGLSKEQRASPHGKALLHEICTADGYRCVDRLSLADEIAEAGRGFGRVQYYVDSAGSYAFLAAVTKNDDAKRRAAAVLAYAAQRGRCQAGDLCG